MDNRKLALNNSTTSTKTLELVQMGLMIAIICVSTMFIKIPSVGGLGYLHPGDSMIFLAVILFGKKKGMITSALGMTLADLLAGYTHYAPFTFVVKAIMALIAASIAYRGDFNGKNLANNIFAFVTAGAWMVFGYFVAKIILVQYVFSEAASLGAAIGMALEGIPGNIAQVVVGILIALPLIKGLSGKVNIRK